MLGKKMYAGILCMMLVVVMAFAAVGCGAKDDATNNPVNTQIQDTQTDSQTDSQTETPQTEASQTDDSQSQDGAVVIDEVLGEGQTMFILNVVDGEGTETNFEIHTDKETVGEALLELELIAGEEGEYGLYVKQVNGITADYDVDQTYWAFYVGDEYATSGVDATTIEEGQTYSLKVSK